MNALIFRLPVGLSLLLLFVLSGCSSEPGESDPDAGLDDVDITSDVEADAEPEPDADEPVMLILESISPDEGPLSGGTTVTLGGQGFQEGMTAYFGEEEAPEVNRQGGLSAQAVTPPAAQEGTVDVTVENPNGTTWTIEDGFTYVEEDEPEPDPDPAEIGYCQTETAELMASPGEESSQITGLVYAEDVTPGAGQGDGVEARLLWGEADDGPDDWTETVDADYLEDVDGLSDGDLANDRYATTVTIDDEGTYGFVFQFRIDDGDWVYCSIDGSDGADDFDPARVGQLEVTEEPEPQADPPEDCNLQFPLIAESPSLFDEDEVMLYGRVFEPGMTDQADLPADLLAQAMIGPAGAHPIDDEGDFIVLGTERNDDYAGDDFEEFQALLALDATGDPDETIVDAGLYAFVFRVSLDGGTTWTHCDLTGVAEDDSIDPDYFGALYVYDETPQRVHYCATFPDNLSGTEDSEGPEIDMEVYEEGITDVPPNQADGDNLEVEAGFGAVGSNPAFAYQWTELDFDGSLQGEPNNFTYLGPLYEEADAPPEGPYQAITRTRIAGEEAWRYCVVSPPDPYDEDADYFIFERATSLTVEAAD